MLTSFVTPPLVVVVIAHALFNFYLVDPLVHAGYTEITLDCKVNEAIKTPVGAPRVLHDPVVASVSLYEAINRSVGAAFASGLALLVGFKYLVITIAFSCSPFTADGLSADSFEFLLIVLIISSLV